MIEIPVLQATPAFGLHENPMGKAAYRYCIQNLVNETVWTGYGFTSDWSKATLYASANEACRDMRKISKRTPAPWLARRLGWGV